MAAPSGWRRTAALLLVSVCVVSLFVAVADCADTKPKKKKDIRDYNDADMARLLEEWEKDDEIEEGDLPEHKRSPPPIDFSKVDPSKPEELLKMSKKGKTLMVFASVSGNPTEKETEEITSLWQGSLFNANFDVQRFVVGSNRVIFMLRDGSYAWEIKDFLTNQDRCEDVTVEGQVYPGKAAKKDSKGKEQNDTKKKKDKKAANRANKSKQEL
ncbi:hypothetical protein SRHO_G00166130 [Serrasalmus rhombeus]